MEITGGTEHHLDKTLTASNRIRDFIEAAWEYGPKKFDSATVANADRVEENKPSVNQFMLMLSHIFNIEQFMRMSKTMMPNRHRVLVIDPGRTSSWGNTITFDSTAVNTAKTGEFYVSTIEPFEATVSTLPSLPVINNVIITMGKMILTDSANDVYAEQYAPFKEVSLVLELNLFYTQDGEYVTNGTEYQNTVSLVDRAGMVFVKECKMEFNNIHSSEIYTRESNIMLSQMIPQDKLETLYRTLSAKETSRQYITHENNAKALTKLTGSMACSTSISIGDTNARYNMEAIERSFHDYTKYMEKLSPPNEFTREIKTVIKGATCPAYKQKSCTIGFMPMCSENRYSDKVSLSGSYGTQTRGIKITLADKTDVLIVQPGKTKLNMTTSMSLYFPDGTRKFLSMVHVAVPFMGTGSKLIGGEISSNKMVTLNIELLADMNNKINSTTGFRKVDVPRMNTDVVSTTSDSFAVNSRNFGMLTGGITVAAKSIGHETHHYGDQFSLADFGNIKIKPVIHETNFALPSGSLPGIFRPDTYMKLLDTNMPLPPVIPFISPFVNDSNEWNKLRWIMNPERGIVLYKHINVIGFEITADPIIKTMGVYFSTSEFQSVVEHIAMKVQDINRDTIPNELSTNMININYDANGQDPKKDSAGLNASRAPSHGLKGVIESDSLQENGISGVHIHNIQHTSNVRITTNSSQHNMMS